MKKTIIAFAAITLFACNNSKKDPAPESNNQTEPAVISGASAAPLKM